MHEKRDVPGHLGLDHVSKSEEFSGGPSIVHALERCEDTEPSQKWCTYWERDWVPGAGCARMCTRRRPVCCVWFFVYI